MSKLVKKVAKVVKKVARSPIGKVALAAAAIYTGGSSLGLFGAGTVAGTAAGAAGAASGGATLGGILSAGSKIAGVFSSFNSLTGGDKQQAIEQDGETIAALRRQEALLAQQKAAVERDRVQADKQEEDIGKSLALQKNAVLARRRGRGGLAFSGPNQGLKTTFGG